jgi:hypothetical protein
MEWGVGGEDNSTLLTVRKTSTVTYLMAMFRASCFGHFLNKYSVVAGFFND